MVLPASHYRQARHNAEFHLQVELMEIPATATTPCNITVSAKVVQVFRARTSLHRGDTVTFGIAVNRPGDDIPAGGAIWIDYDNLASHRFMEVFLDGEPPECNVALWQCRLLDAPSQTPQMND
jgi:hypothetical protein